ncbi:MAG: DUF1156 domain-containing protein [Candidatus Hodarchaeota archaeon]
MKKRVIEWNLPLAEISKASSHEKSVRHGHPSTLHLWWARRPLASSRATIFAALIDLPSSSREKQEINKLIKDISPWNAVKEGLSPIIRHAQEILKEKWEKTPPKVIDPFSGGGSIPLEALRLGCETYACDLNPVAVLIGKATLEWPQKIANSDLAIHVEKWAKKINETVKTEIGQFYPSDSDGKIPIGYLWAREIKCPNPICKAEIPLIKHFWLARKKNRSIAYKPIINEQEKTFTFQIQENQEIDFDPSIGTISRGRARCLICNQVVLAVKIREMAQQGKLHQRMTIVILRSPNRKNKFYRVANDQDIIIYTRASNYLYQELEKNQVIESLMPNEDLPPPGTLGFSVQNYGMTKWSDLFNPRQLLALITFLKHIRGLFQQIKNEYYEKKKSQAHHIEFPNIIISYLSIILSRLADKNASLVVYNAYGEKIEHVFGRTALPMAWDYVELNVFSGANGDWLHQVNWVTRFIKTNCWKPFSSSSVHQASATKLSFPNEYFDAVLTDPPYYDNIPYSDLSDFFYIWFKRALREIFPDLFATPLSPKTEEIVANKGRQTNPKAFFEENISFAFKEMYRILKQDGIAIIVYAHRSNEGWETMLRALVRAGFVITASWPIHTEMKARLRARSSAALGSSIYLVCRKLPQRKIGYFNEIRQEIEGQVLARLKQFWNEGIRGGDFFISAIGPAMEVLSQYRQIERYSGEIVSFQEQLKYIRSISANFLINGLIGDKEAIPTLDKPSQFYLAFRWTFQNNLVDYGEAQILGQACGINLDQEVKTGLINKKGSKIELLAAQSRSYVNKEEKNFVNLMHQSVIAWKEGNEKKLERLLKQQDSLKTAGFWRFCQAVAECLPEKNIEKQLLEGLLVSKYSK